MKHIIYICTLLLLFSSPTYGSADSYRFVTLEYPPLEYAGKDGRAHGAAVELVTKIMGNLGHNVQISVLDWTRALDMVRTGDADAIFTAFRNPERETFLDYSLEVLVPQVVYFYSRSNQNISFEGDFQNLHGYKIGTVSTISYGREFDRARPRLTILQADTLEHNFRELLAGSLDLVICNSYEADRALNQLHLTGKITRLPHEVERVPSYIAFSKKKNLLQLRDRFDRELIRLKSGGEYSRILRKYGIHIQ